MPTISACLVLHNEERLLKRCLDSLIGLVEEIIVVHDGPCLDNTLAIAKSYGAKIIIAPRSSGIAEFGRILSYEAVKGEWILQIDADEFLSPDLKKAIPALIKKPEVNAFEFIWPLYNGQRYLTRGWPYKRCLWRRSAMSYVGVPHYVAEVTGQVVRQPLILEHRPTYNNYSWEIFKKKWVKWATIQATMTLLDFSQVPKFQCRYHDWPRPIKLRKNFPLLLIFFDGPFIFIKTVIGGWRQGWPAWQLAFFFALFRTILLWQIFYQRWKT